MKIYVYFLIKDDSPYYVGVTINKNNRYSKEKKSQMVFIEECTNRISARNLEEYWINQLIAWGFNIVNRDKVPKLLPIETRAYHKEPLTLCRIKITAQQRLQLEQLEQCHHIPASALIRMALDSFLPKISNSGFSEKGIKAGYLNGNY